MLGIADSHSLLCNSSWWFAIACPVYDTDKAMFASLKMHEHGRKCSAANTTPGCHHAIQHCTLRNLQFSVSQKASVQTLLAVGNNGAMQSHRPNRSQIRLAGLHTSTSSAPAGTSPPCSKGTARKTRLIRHTAPTPSTMHGCDGLTAWGIS